jgi:uncharacterized protein (DUF3820 family)
MSYSNFYKKNISLSERARLQLKFGKYKGEFLGSVVRGDIQYVRWYIQKFKEDERVHVRQLCSHLEYLLKRRLDLVGIVPSVRPIGRVKSY